jgi:hypothetical protein
MVSTSRLFQIGLMLIVVVAAAVIVNEVVRDVPPTAALPQVPPRPAAQRAAALVIATPTRGAELRQEWTWRLAGTLIVPGRRDALFARGTEKRTVREGEAIDGWVLAAVDADNVRLTGPEGERTLSLERDKAVVNAAAADQQIRADQRERRRAAQRTEAAMQELTRAMMASQ